MREQGKRGAEQDRPDARLGAQVRRVDTEAGVHDGGEDHRHNGQPGCEPRQQFGTPPPVQKYRRHQRPHQVELLLDRERPQVVQRCRGDIDVPVPDMGQHVVPVRPIDQRRASLPHRLAVQARTIQEMHPDQHGEQQHDDRRCKAPHAPRPKPSQLEPAGALLLAYEQPGNEVTRQDEEQIDAEKPTRQVAVVVCEHNRDRHRPQAIQRRDRERS